MGKSVLGHLQLLLSADSAQITSDMGKARDAVRTATGSMQGSAAAAMKTITAQVQGLGPALRGVQQATGAAVKGLELLGSKGSPAVAGITNALSGLVSGGFTPLGVAIGAASALIGTLTADVSKAEKATIALQQSSADAARGLESQLETYKKIHELRLSEQANRSGMSPEERATANRLDSARLRLEAVGKRMESADVDVTRLTYLEREERLRGNLHNQYAYELQDAQKRMDALIRESDDLKSVIRDLEALTKARKDEADSSAAAAAAKAQAKSYLAGQTDYDATVSPFKGFGGYPLDPIEQRQSDADDEARRRRAEAMAKRFLDSQTDYDTTANKYRDFGGHPLDSLEQKWSDASDEASRSVKQFRQEVSEAERASEVAMGSFADHASSAFTDFAMGAATAEEAFSSLARSFVADVMRMASQQAVLSAISGVFGFASPTSLGGTGGVPTGAHGGTWRVGGTGGLDSKLVSMRLSPGEMVKVTNGANSGGSEGPISVSLAVRPPAVIADDVLARSSPAARAAVVSSVVTRGGRRGMRAKDA